MRGGGVEAGERGWPGVVAESGAGFVGLEGETAGVAMPFMT